MGTEREFKPQSLKSRVMWYALGCSVALIGAWLFAHKNGWALVRMAALFLVILVPLSEWYYRRQARAAGRDDD